MSEIRLPEARRRLTALIQSSGDTITVDDAVSALGADRQTAAKALARWTAQGWLRRVSRGVYVAATIDALDRKEVLSDPWVLVPTLYEPCYIGGRTAAEYWDLTEQMFRDIVVMTTRGVREKHQVRHGAVFSLHHIASEKLFGTTAVWRGQTRVALSDVHRTVVDILANPDLGGGFDQVVDCLTEYLRRDDANEDRLIAYGDQLGNSTVFKRLGYLIEKARGSARLIEACRIRIRPGISKLDPDRRSGRIDTRWHLYVPAPRKVPS